MIRFPHKIKQLLRTEDDTVYVYCSENQEEKIQVQRLLAEIKIICAISTNGKTGLYITTEFTIGEHLVGVFSLAKKIIIAEGEVEKIRQKLNLTGQSPP